MPRFFRTALAVLCAMTASVPVALGKNCGGIISCECGDTVVESTKLAADVSGCSRMGLRVAPAVTLDCAGYGVLGRSSKDGLFLDEARGAKVRNCRVEGFRVGVRVSGSSDQLVLENQLVGNRRGIAIDGGARDVRIERNVIRDSLETGILLQPRTTGIELVSNTIVNSRRENVRIVASHDVFVDRNVLGGQPRVGLQVTHAHDGYFRGNEIQTSDVEVRGDCTGNVFTDNDLLDGGFEVKTQELDEVVYSPEHNNFLGGSIPNARRCFILAGASYNVIRDVRIGQCRARPVELKTRDGIPSVGNVIDLPTATTVGETEKGLCGGKKKCQCGDRVTESVRLEEDLTGCSKTGLVVGSGVTLDCLGFGVFGQSSGEGIRVEGQEARVRNCKVRGFSAGARLREGSGHRISANTFTGNRRGIVVDGATSYSLLDDNLIEQSREIGVELRDGTVGIEVARNTILDSGRQNLDVSTAVAAVVDNNLLGGTTSVGIRLTDTSGARVRGNVVATEGVEVRGGSTHNLFLDNDLEDEGYAFSGIEDQTGLWRFPQHNSIRGGSVLKARTCFRFYGASYNDVQGVGVRACEGREVENKKVDGNEPTDNFVDVVPR